MPEQAEFTDRALVVALTNVVAALAERLTGELPVYRVDDGKGNWCWYHPTTERVRWEKEAAERPAGGGPDVILYWQRPDGQLWHPRKQAFAVIDGRTVSLRSLLKALPEGLVREAAARVAETG